MLSPGKPENSHEHIASSIDLYEKMIKGIQTEFQNLGVKIGGNPNAGHCSIAYVPDHFPEEQQMAMKLRAKQLIELTMALVILREELQQLSGAV
jgi:hypothetical protein